MAPKTEPAPIIWHGELASTNSHAMALAARGEAGPVWIAARRQTAGRGRSGRSWEVDEGNLAASLIFTPSAPPSDLAQLSFVAGVAAFDAIADVMSNRDGETSANQLKSGMQLKWPNDILIDGAKVAGLLVETTMVGREMRAIIGVGINVVSAPVLTDRETTALQVLVPASAQTKGAPISAEIVLDKLSRHIARELETWANGDGFSKVREAWLARGLPIGAAMRVHTGNAQRSGTFAGLDADGALLIREPTGSVLRLTHGDVTVDRAG
ncbi:MAG: biotin--[acetyl-CoA-carboxylase] ligase [Pseudomonadota bacterium]